MSAAYRLAMMCNTSGCSWESQLISMPERPETKPLIDRRRPGSAARHLCSLRTLEPNPFRPSWSPNRIRQYAMARLP